MSLVTEGPATTNISIRKDKEIKSQSKALYSELDLNLTTAIKVFLRQTLRVGGFPFNVCLDKPNQESIIAMIEAEILAHDHGVKKYADVEEALAELK